ncbi:MAG TPA: MTH1187 family thiamine-binding protein [Candidatus Manganitrophaceae bacterium]|nr:MTH1187 family thiamine-binding protein [Candidatus Manganitrophaceae bacterium]
MALLEINIVPVGTESPSIGDHVAEVIRMCDQQGLKYQITDMGTIIDGDPETLFSVAKLLHEIPFSRGVSRVLTHLTIDDRRDKIVQLDDEVKAVEERLAEDEEKAA